MIKVNTILTVLDNSNVYTVKCIGSRKYSNKKSFDINDIIMVSTIKTKNFEKGKVLPAIIATTRYPYKRKTGEILKFQNNGVILLKTYNKELIEALGNRVSYPVPKEVKEHYPSIANIINEVI